MLYFFLRPISILVSKMFFFFKVRNVENLPKKGGFIIASNHLSFLDPVALGTACYRRLHFMARNDLFSCSWFGWLITSLGAFPLRKGESDIMAFRRALEIIRQNKVLVIFPEGRRSAEGKLVKGLPGIGFLAAKSKASVIPTLIEGTAKALPVKAKTISFFKRITVSFGKPLRFNALDLEDRKTDYQSFADFVMGEIKKLKA